MSDLPWRVQPEPIPEVGDDFYAQAQDELGYDVEELREIFDNSNFFAEYLMFLWDKNINFRREVIDHNQERIDTRAAELQQIAAENALIDEADGRMG